jgi:hypothetical protein
VVRHIARQIACPHHSPVVTYFSAIDEGRKAMENNINFDDKASSPATGRNLTRREWVQRMLAGAGAGIATPALAEAHWTEAAAAQAAAPTEAEGDWKPTFFDDAQNQALIVLAERIVPGSTGAQVNRFLDIAIGASTQASQLKFVAAMNAMEGESLRQFSKSFRELSAQQQDAVLSAASTAKPSNPTLSAAKETEPGVHSQVPSLRDYFEHLKGWVSTAYYSSEVGMKELGWNGENFFESFPGCEHAAGHS